MPKDSWSYKRAGVDIDAGAEAVDAIKELVKKTRRPGVVSEIGGFSGLFRLEPGTYRDPVLVSSTDGVGTKVRIAQYLGKHDTVGIDLVAMCVNDIVVTGAEPLFFLDYIACDKVEVGFIKDVVKGISDGCAEAGCALLGGETAEMPGVYREGEYDLAGFVVGAVEGEEVIDGKTIATGDTIIGLPSSGLHSNGYSLVRKLFPEPDRDFAALLLTPTRIYARQVLTLLKKVKAKGIAHITGGGVIDNVSRILPAGASAVFDTGSWNKPGIFDTLQTKGNIDLDEMYRVFNMGLGMVIVVAESDADTALEMLAGAGEQAVVVGRIEKGHGTVVLS